MQVLNIITPYNVENTGTGIQNQQGQVVN